MPGEVDLKLFLIQKMIPKINKNHSVFAYFTIPLIIDVNLSLEALAVCYLFS